jgi:NAD(P)-dependent dehydrogenase (short-subunit alcohol dehydrogenase family)
MDTIVAESGNRHVAILLADLSSQSAVRQLVQEFQHLYTQLHVLINNSGVAPIQRSVTEDGSEVSLAVNYLAPFLLTKLLLEVLEASAPARVINVAGDFHRKATIDFDDLMSETNYSGVRANNQAKLTGLTV